MAGNTSKIELISNALILIGDAPISSLEDRGAGSIAASNLYENTYRGLLSEHMWRFAIKNAQLSRLAGEPTTPYKYAFQLPSDFIYLVRAGGKNNYGAIQDFEIYEDQVHCNYPELWVDYTYRVNEDKLPAWFVQTFEFLLASKLAIPVTGNSTRAQYYAGEYERQVRKARHADASERPNKVIQDNPFVTARY